MSTSLLGLRHRQRAQHDVIDESEDGGVGADADGERENRGKRVARRFAELMEGEAEVGPEVFQPAPLPDFDAALACQGSVAESAAGFARCLFRVAATLDERGRTLSDMLLDLFGEVVFGVLAKGEIAEPGHL